LFTHVVKAAEVVPLLLLLLLALTVTPPSNTPALNRKQRIMQQLGLAPVTVSFVKKAKAVPTA
jgi:hypothetical protein